MKRIKLLYLLMLIVVVSACKDDDFDGLQNVDPYPENAVTFPDSGENGIALMDDNAFIINQNAVAAGQVVVKIKGPSSGKLIKSIEAKAQRFRGNIVWPNLSPTVPTTAAQRAPSGFGRTSVSNLAKIDFTPANEISYTIDLANIPASLTNATLGAVAAPSGTTPAYDVFRFFFLVTYDDGTTVLSNEVRVVVKG